MSRKTLRQLGWDARRIRLVLRQSEWAAIDAEAQRLAVDVTDVISGNLAVASRDFATMERIALTRKGEKAADAAPDLASQVVQQWGRSEW